MNILTERWVVIDGSIYTERAVPVKSEFTGKLFAEPQRFAIAFNVGHKTATHIVNLHNAGLQHAHT
jgi:hypothetical protein